MDTKVENRRKSTTPYLPYIYNSILTVVLIGGGFYFGNKVYDKMVKIDRTNELAIANFTESNKKNVLLKVIDIRMKIPVEQKVKLRDTIYDLCYLKDIPLSLICGLIEVESGWNHEANSEANAKGLMQVLPSTARPYLRFERIDYNEKSLLDPVKCVTVGICYLSDLHIGHIEANKDDDNYSLSLHSYFWGASNTMTLYGKKDTRVNVPNFSYPIRVIEASKKYKEMGL